MYSFELTEEQNMLAEAIARFASSDVRGAAREAEEQGALPPKMIQKGWELGVLQASIPEAYGGFGEHSCVTAVIAGEELAFGDVAAAFAIGTPALFALPILMAGTEEQKAATLPKVIGGGWQPYTAGLIEYAYDFDPSDLRTTAKAETDGYVLSGEKAFVPYAREAEGMLIYASLNGQTQGFIVQKGTQGVSIDEKREELLGLNALPMYRVRLENARIPLAARFGGDAGHDFAPILSAMHLGTACAAVGLARAAMEYSRDYAKEREVFGVKVAQKQAIAFMLAEMATEIEASRLLTWEAAWKLDVGKPDAFHEAFQAAQGAADMALMVADRAVQILGGHGYIREHPVELWLRNARGLAMLTGLAIV